MFDIRIVEPCIVYLHLNRSSTNCLIFSSSVSYSLLLLGFFTILTFTFLDADLQSFVYCLDVLARVVRLVDVLQDVGTVALESGVVTPHCGRFGYLINNVASLPKASASQ